ncbi:hypothetical protein EON63_23515, partial [archaeon]
MMCGIDTCYYNPDDSACKGSTDPKARTCLGAPNHNVCVQDNECFSNCKTHMHEHIHMHTYTYMYTCMHISIHIHRHTHIITHTNHHYIYIMY